MFTNIANVKVMHPKMNYAIHFFKQLRSGLSFCYYKEAVRASPSPTKLLPKNVQQGDGSYRYETSVFLHEGESDIPWEYSKYVYRGVLAFGGIDFLIEVLPNAGLDIEIKEGEIHANIIGWDGDEEIQQIQAIKLARRALVRVHPSSEAEYLAVKDQKLLDYKRTGVLLQHAITVS